METVIDRKTVLRPLASEDLKAVMAIDQAVTGHSRLVYFGRRLAAAQREPALHAQFAANDGAGLAGYVLARIMAGEFGRVEPGLRIEAIGVRPDAQGHGLGHQLLSALAAFARRHDIHEVRTAAAWNDHVMLRWFSATGFRLAPNYVLDCDVSSSGHLLRRSGAEPSSTEPAAEINYDDAAANDFERSADEGADIRSMAADDLREVVRIDRAITGRSRADYMRDKFDEAMDDAVIRVSLTARSQGTITGFVMARADLGDFGRAAPVAILDTIGVDPAYAHLGIGRALLSQLSVNLGALHIERVETVVGPAELPLLGFFHDAGFRPSQRLPFLLRVE